ncbi:hypothetical protein WMY93_026920 [Mugilogobius chulae]|uniref:Uncharacterized protein n=1 Tax=Mugilogobius chulae TaxID=88201 RepID=A0AAW0N390_9GOBI
MENTLVFLLLLCSFSSAHDSSEEELHDFRTVLREMTAALAEHKVKIEHLQAFIKEQATKEKQSCEVGPLKEQLQKQAAKLEELEKQSSEVEEMKEQLQEQAAKFEELEKQSSEVKKMKEQLQELEKQSSEVRPMKEQLQEQAAKFEDLEKQSSEVEEMNEQLQGRYNSESPVLNMKTQGRDSSPGGELQQIGPLQLAASQLGQCQRIGASGSSSDLMFQSSRVVPLEQAAKLEMLEKQSSEVKKMKEQLQEQADKVEELEKQSSEVEEMKEQLQEQASKFEELEKQSSEVGPMKEQLQEQAAKLEEMEKQSNEVKTVKEQLQEQAAKFKELEKQSSEVGPMKEQLQGPSCLHSRTESRGQPRTELDFLMTLSSFFLSLSEMLLLQQTTRTGWQMPPQSRRRSSGVAPHSKRPESSQKVEPALAFPVQCISVVSPVQFIVQMNTQVLV